MVQTGSMQYLPINLYDKIPAIIAASTKYLSHFILIASLVHWEPLKCELRSSICFFHMIFVLDEAFQQAHEQVKKSSKVFKRVSQYHACTRMALGQSSLAREPDKISYPHKERVDQRLLQKLDLDILH